MNPPDYEIVGEHFRWIRATSEIEDTRDRTRRPDSDYSAKVDVYEDCVKHWFLDIAERHVAGGMAPGDYVALSIALAYIEGVEQYRQGTPTPDKRSKRWFMAGVRRLFPLAAEEVGDELWNAARNGLFHDGFTKGPTLLSHGYGEAVEISDGYLRINPARFVASVKGDFSNYVSELRTNPDGELAKKFVCLWDERWEKT